MQNLQHDDAFTTALFVSAGHGYNLIQKPLIF